MGKLHDAIFYSDEPLIREKSPIGFKYHSSLQHKIVGLNSVVFGTGFLIVDGTAIKASIPKKSVCTTINDRFMAFGEDGVYTSTDYVVWTEIECPPYMVGSNTRFIKTDFNDYTVIYQNTDYDCFLIHRDTNEITIISYSQVLTRVSGIPYYAGVQVVGDRQFIFRTIETHSDRKYEVHLRKTYDLLPQGYSEAQYLKNRENVQCSRSESIIRISQGIIICDYDTLYFLK